MTSTTQQRRDRIERGSKRGASLGQRADARTAIIENRQSIGNGPHIDTGASSIDDMIARDAAKRSMAADSYEPPTHIDVEPNRTDPALRVPLSFLLADLRAGVKRWTRGLSKAARQDVATDAALLILNWTRQGATSPIYCGARGNAPLKRDWYETDQRQAVRDGAATRPMPNDRAKRAMRAAILQAKRKRDGDTELALDAAMPDTLSTDDDRESTQLSLGQAAMRAHEQQTAIAPTLPDADEPEELADAMGVSLSAARHLIASGYRMSVDQCSRAWNVSRKRAENIRSQGKREILKRYPEPWELLDALATAAGIYRARLETRAYLALSDVKYSTDRKSAEQRAAEAVNAYRSAIAALPTEARAIELAARRVGYAPEAISASGQLQRLARAEQRRGERTATSAGSASASPGQRDSASALPLSRMRAPVPTAPQPLAIIGQTQWTRGAGNGYSGACDIGARLARWQRTR